MTLKLTRTQYAEMYGPTVGDRVRLGDTNLFIEVERDLIEEGGGYGNEIKFGGGKVIRDGMGQSPLALGADCLDLVVTNATILDPILGVIKADVGVKDGRISGVGHGGNPLIQDGVSESMVVGAGTEVIAGEGMILTAGGYDSHIHFICPQQIEEAIASGLTTMTGGGTGPATGTNATTCTPGSWNLGKMLQAADSFPMNLGFLGKGNSSSPDALREQVEAGAIGLKLHEDWGTPRKPFPRKPRRGQGLRSAGCCLGRSFSRWPRRRQPACKGIFARAHRPPPSRPEPEPTPHRTSIPRARLARCWRKDPCSEDRNQPR